MKKYQKLLSEIFHFLVIKFSVHLNRRDFIVVVFDALRVKTFIQISCVLITNPNFRVHIFLVCVFLFFFFFSLQLLFSVTIFFPEL